LQASLTVSLLRETLHTEDTRKLVQQENAI